MTMDHWTIAAGDLRRTIKEIEAVGGIRFSLQLGEIFGQSGPNGAGKTILLSLLPPRRP